MTYRTLLRAGLAAAGAILFTAVLPAADYKEAAHPLCRQDPRDPCVKLTINIQGTHHSAVSVDRLEAKVQNTCKVPMKSGALRTASTDSVTLPDATAWEDVVTRAFWFPKGCYVWVHLREPIINREDHVVAQTLHFVEDMTVKLGLAGDEPYIHNR